MLILDKFEAMPELSVLLEENFLQDEKGRWYIPDTTKEGDIEKLREKNLWKQIKFLIISRRRSFWNIPSKNVSN